MKEERCKVRYFDPKLGRRRQCPNAAVKDGACEEHQPLNNFKKAAQSPLFDLLYKRAMES